MRKRHDAFFIGIAIVIAIGIERREISIPIPIATAIAIGPSTPLAKDCRYNADMLRKPFQLIRKRYRRIALLLIILTAVTVMGSHYRIEWACHGSIYTDVDTIPHNRVGLVLGCSKTVASGATNLFFRHRIAAAAELYHAGKVDYLIVSGDNSRKTYDEPTDMKAALVAQGVPAEAIYCDYAGFRTLDSVVRANAIFQCRQITVISQHFHNKRAIFLAECHGIAAIGFNAHDVPSRYATKTYVREQLAKIKSVLDVYVFGTEPKFYGPVISIGDVDTAI